MDDARAPRPPSVDRLARSLTGTGLPHPLLVDVAREAIAAGDPDSAAGRAARLAHNLLREVLNATGVLLHTNLGRAPWPMATPARFHNLEFDLDTGKRGSRHAHAAALLARACGAESALVVNNGAAAVLLALAALAERRPVAVSRGELVEIGGGFRVPEVMAQSGAQLVEVGTTNRTRAADFRAALSTHPDLALVLRVHRSNYRITGFTEDPDDEALADLGVPLVVDIGSGLLDDACPWLPEGPPSWLRGEPAARQILERGASLVTFSGDKLLGGPQAGIIAGSAELVTRCASHPLARALRPGGHVLGGLQELALHYLARRGTAIPFWRMATIEPSELEARARAIDAPATVATVAVPGGGTLPGVEIASAGLAYRGDHAAALRACDPPIVARVENDQTILDLRTVDPSDDEFVARAVVDLPR